MLTLTSFRPFKARGGEGRGREGKGRRRSEAAIGISSPSVSCRDGVECARRWESEARIAGIRGFEAGIRMYVDVGLLWCPETGAWDDRTHPSRRGHWRHVLRYVWCLWASYKWSPSWQGETGLLRLLAFKSGSEFLERRIVVLDSDNSLQVTLQETVIFVPRVDARAAHSRDFD